jgi:uncharacterized membrane protein YdbT with pleckstrin-like domain
MVEEEIVWEGGPSQVTRLGTYVLCVLFCWLIVPIFIALWTYIVIRHHKYIVTTERIKITTGVFSRHHEEIELYRIKDFQLLEPFFLRMFGLGNILFHTSDKTTPNIILEAVSDAETLRDSIREHVEALREKKNVREVDYE